jgi:hypothetical protein
MNILTTGMLEIHQGFISKLKNCNVHVEKNFEQVLGTVRDNEVNRICILMDVWNISGRNCNSARGQYAAERIHEINPIIPILIWDGREYNCPRKNICPVFQVFGEIIPIKYSNELYLMPQDYMGEQVRITLKFFEGSLIAEDIPKKEMVSFDFGGQNVFRGP